MPSNRVAHYNDELERAIQASLAEEIRDNQFKKDLADAQLKSLTDTGQPTSGYARPLYQRPPSPGPPPPSPLPRSLQKPQSGLFARLRNGLTRRNVYLADTPDNNPIDTNSIPLRMSSIFPRRTRSAKVALDPGPSFIDPRTAGIRRSRKIRKSKRRRRKTRRTH